MTAKSLADPPLVSIIVPVYNRASMVLETVGSALEAGTGVDCEVIVVDDASTDDTASRLRSFEDPLT